MNNFFDKIYCINLDSRADRWSLFLKELDRIQLTGCEKFKGFEMTSGQHGHAKSYCSLIDLCLAQPHNNYLLLEDDVLFMGEPAEVVDALSLAFSELPENYDALYLGGTLCNNYVDTPIVNYSTHLYKLYSAFATHAVVFSYKGLEKIRSSFSASTDWWKELLLGKADSYTTDVYLAENFLPKNNCYITKKMLCSQRPNYSNILNKYVDYTSLMLERLTYFKDKINE